MKNDVVCLYCEHDYSAMDWAIGGYDVYLYDIKNQDTCREIPGGGRIITHYWDARDEQQNNALVNKHYDRTTIVLAFPPCTDLAVSGAAWFAKKREANPQFQEEAMQLVYTAQIIASRIDAPYAIENPVSVVSSLWRKPDYTFNPCDYGGYLPEDDVHPDYPKYIAPRDAYNKRTCYWTSKDFVMPAFQPVKPLTHLSAQHRLLGGKSEETKRIRSASPRGIARAIYLANAVRTF